MSNDWRIVYEICKLTTKKTGNYHFRQDISKHAMSNFNFKHGRGASTSLFQFKICGEFEYFKCIY